MQVRIRRGIAALIALTAATALAIGPAGAGSAASRHSASAASLRAFGITSDGKVMAEFTTDKPEELNWVRRISGLVNDTAAIGIDFRVQDGKFYAVGNRGGVYTISLPTGAQDPVVVTKVSQLGVALQGTNFGVDFNPAADRLRVISDTGQNLRHNLNDNTTVPDTPLSTDSCAPAVTGVSAAAYTNNDLNSATATTLFDINTTTGQVVIQSPANSGLLAPTGALGTSVGSNAGLDIYSDLSNGKTVSNSAYATLVLPNGDATLNAVDLTTGAATRIGDPFPLAITDIALALDSN
ncbi:hypothetical protein Skr01_42330 [Sphaerisporangium krabiense]|uniref:DUF4394 domain-containing protein n=1 Tax=Sphaerisporangium krabiense TaxID=763782 RepID=A0A7W8Z103_9ACTN|nr:DUF4394 domain-containing protein [Sphaerisporangium krabiense]MBB5625337.1 hypothetical protein [Sphaerisporangium krabiense]GII64148.1 hypothetical protein Skr01_42330 [Sphaerisporangium krabiense]